MLSAPIDSSAFLGPRRLFLPEPRLSEDMQADSAVSVLTTFIKAHGGKVKTDAMRDLYQAKIWLKSVIGRLMDFCAKHSSSFTYMPRDARSKAMFVCAMGGEGEEVEDKSNPPSDIQCADWQPRRRAKRNDAKTLTVSSRRISRASTAW